MPIDLLMILLALTSLMGVGAAGYFYRELRRVEALSQQQAVELSAAKAKLDHMGPSAARADSAIREVADLRERLARAETEVAARAQAQDEARQALEQHFTAMATRTLAANQEQFFGMANQVFEKHSQTAQGGVKEVVAPVQEQLAKLAQSVADLDQRRAADGAALGVTLKAVAESVGETRAVTGQLVTALRSNSKTRGNWGEQTLRNVLELAGLSRHADFSEQNTVSGDDGKLRPDVVINLPGGGAIVVDAKVALTGFFEAMEAADEASREAFMKKHAREVRLHVQRLAKQDYSTFVPNAVDFVAMFIPGENFFAAAAERDGELFEFAVKNKVIIVTPATLVALAKAVAYGWRQEESAKNAQVIAETGRELYRRLARMAELVGGVGASLETSVKRYNEMARSFETRLLPQGRRFRELGAGDPSVEIKDVEAVDQTPYMLPSPDAGVPAAGPKKGRGV